jgi:hypothetical protein
MHLKLYNIEYYAIKLHTFLLFPDAHSTIERTRSEDLTEFWMGPFHLPYRACVGLPLRAEHPLVAVIQVPHLDLLIGGAGCKSLAVKVVRQIVNEIVVLRRELLKGTLEGVRGE